MEAPWCGLQAPEVDLQCLVKYLKDNKVTLVYEFGAGVSTQRMSEAGIIVRSFETHAEYAGLVNEYFKSLELNPMPTVSHYVEGPEFMQKVKELPQARVCFVDGPRGTKELSRIHSLEAAALLADTILLHDAQRRGERQSLNRMRTLGWKIGYLPGAVKRKKIAVLTRS